jgi:hypothetical protein
MKKIRKEDYFTLAIFCAHYHSGQWSRGYRLLCKLRAKWSSNDEREAEEDGLYLYLVANYGDKI